MTKIMSVFLKLLHKVSNYKRHKKCMNVFIISGLFDLFSLVAVKKKIFSRQASELGPGWYFFAKGNLKMAAPWPGYNRFQRQVRPPWSMRGDEIFRKGNVRGSDWDNTAVSVWNQKPQIGVHLQNIWNHFYFYFSSLIICSIELTIYPN